MAKEDQNFPTKDGLKALGKAFKKAGVKVEQGPKTPKPGKGK